MRLLSLAVFALSTALWLPLGAARADLLVNGDFELAVPANDTGNGWTSSGQSVSWNGTCGNPGGCFTLNESGQLESDPIVEQVVANLAIGASYRIEGERIAFAGGFGNPAAFAFAVLLDDEPLLELDRGESNAEWEPFSVEFVATATTHTVGFAAERNGDDSSYRIDNVSLRLVPEPSSSMLLLAGCAGIGALRVGRRR